MNFTIHTNMKVKNSGEKVLLVNISNQNYLKYKIKSYILFNNNFNFCASGKCRARFSNFEGPCSAKLDTSVSREAFKNCNESTNLRFPNENEIYFSMLFGIQENVLFLYFPDDSIIRCISYPRRL